MLADETSAAAAAWISGASGAGTALFWVSAEPVPVVPEAAIMAAATKAKYRALLILLTFLSWVSGLFTLYSIPGECEIPVRFSNNICE